MYKFIMYYLLVNDFIKKIKLINKINQLNTVKYKKLSLGCIQLNLILYKVKFYIIKVKFVVNFGFV